LAASFVVKAMERWFPVAVPVTTEIAAETFGPRRWNSPGQQTLQGSLLERETTMSRGMPSMTALLGLLALAGYQNRDKLAELLKGATSTGQPAPGSGQPTPGSGRGPLDGLFGNLGGVLGGSGVGGLLGSGLGELLERFKQNGQGEAAESWINKGPNKELPAPQLKQAIGADVLAALERQTGLSQEELLARLSRELPSAVDQYTPDGRLPS